MNGFHHRHAAPRRRGAASALRLAAPSVPAPPAASVSRAPAPIAPAPIAPVSPAPISPAPAPTAPASRVAAPPLTFALLALTLLATALPPPLLAGEADVLDGTLTPLGNGSYRISATVRHADSGWDHYADRWDVLAPDGTLLGSRELLHPHENEQPFTRSLTLDIPAGIARVTLRAADSVHGTGGASVELDVPR